MKKVFSLNDIVQVAGWLLQQLGDQKIIAFYGQMGAGKTTLIYTVCQVLQVEDVVSSPTFSIINEYRFPDNGQSASVYHMDLYRLQDEEEAVRAGVEDCLYSGHYCFVEWPEKAPDLFPGETLYVSLSVVDEERREIEILKNK
ncbi:tRNA (adenosine(37)-N6)-threonylcarbamoyltransferase complex ATPase subunit type 1 TsaE [Niabella drilacis]|uniref:tRNA threonylcarbamoyladenosine biosynthesis protein TsaE n=1 Tax=Niabella drilacis (strain DSM 25811 / CCM 8410 / CCUG 62505 / LMG 26954 / E90) TaxID=1285928 RepID=A0A1G6Q345_NIADE|nr:tRNA (adenosine(37)-N6)-threonylcarbamoyltransferase complex ATPase subunit type 1 TsaE [Niabella drilacis]SDC86860.1 tRNA threonylcarbamoyladenosine biosynthesis protein TsaE [Niabella drilacis]